MDRTVRSAVVGAAAAALAVAPWAGAFRSAVEVVDDRPPARVELVKARPATLPQIAGRRASGRGGCGCNEVVVNVENMLEDADIRTGDAEVRNVNVTYISAAYVDRIEGEIEIEVEQIADAVTGDATAGQMINALHAGSRCANILIRAINILEDVEVQTGDAVAVNRNIVLLDPGVDRGRLDLDVEQEANARSGRATAGQVISGLDAGRDANGCGGVTVEATNEIEDVELRTGEAHSSNENSVRTCQAVGCVPELLALTKTASTVRMCTEDGCRVVPAAQLALLLEPADAPSPEPILPPADEQVEEVPPPSETETPEPSPSPTPDPEPEDPPAPPADEPSPSPSPSPAQA